MKKKSNVMRSIFAIFLLTTATIHPLVAQENNRGFEFNFSLVHPAKWGLSDYKYSVDPTLEVLYFTSISKKFWVAGGLFAQVGKHNWIEKDSHPFWDGFMWQGVRGEYYSRQLEFFSVGIPVKMGMNFNNSFFNSFFWGFTAGNHLKLEMADYLNSKFIADLPVYRYYNSEFWELNIGFKKMSYKKEGIAVSLSPVAGFRKASSEKDIGYSNYFFYGLGISSRIGK